MGSESSIVLNNLHKHRYYLPGGDVYFLVENQMFRVHRYFLERESPVFRERFQFQLPSAPGGLRNGESESTAIVLDVPATTFEKLLDVFYNPTYSVYGWSLDDWTTIIRFALEWEFPEVRDLAIRELNKMDIPLTFRIDLYQRLNLDQKHLVPLYATLCRRPRALNNQESKDIGLATTVLIFNARERLRARPSNGSTSPLPPNLQDSDIHATLMALLGGTAPST